MNPQIRHVYVHFPYCLHRCNYCDFATTTAKIIPRELYLQHILTELEIRSQSLEFAPLETIFFGGGTPSLWGPQNIAAVLAALEKRAGFVQQPEITLEANPGALEAGDLLAYTQAGIRRVSIGVQALDNARLRQLDRLHDAETAHTTLKQLANLLQAGQLQSANADLIFGVPGQTMLELKSDLDALLAYGLPHLSAYALTVEPGTPLALQVKKGKAPAPEDDVQAAMLDALGPLVQAHGLQRYEVSNYARPGQECQHNLAYWTGRYYLALGVGAHGFVPHPGHLGLRYGNTRKNDAWLRALGQRELAEEFREPIDAAQHLDERLLTGMRLTRGLDLQRLEADLGTTARQRLENNAQKALNRGDIWLNQTHLGVQPNALHRLDGLIAELA